MTACGSGRAAGGAAQRLRVLPSFAQRWLFARFAGSTRS
jgi:hypothetical protein